jgi:hypothetical protein
MARSQLKGGDDLRRRIKAIRLAFKPIGAEWATTTAGIMRPAVPNRTGRLRKSFRKRNATQKRAVVGGHYTAYFVDAGPKAHDIVPKGAKRLVFPIGGRTIYSRKVHHRGYRARPFRARSAREGYRRTPKVAEIINQWNRAA